MPPPTTTNDLIDRLRKSGLVPADRLDGFLVGLQAAGHPPLSPADMLSRMVDAGMITPFHSDRLAAGKYKGFVLGSYLILDQLGSGGMGQVYLAEHTAMRRLVALKVLPVFSADDVVARERFLREARAAAALDHPNIVRVFDLCQDGKLMYLVMEYVEGVSLQALVARHGQIDSAAACHYVRQVAFGLQHAHELGFVHRDIKPANLLLERSGVVKILDLGLVRSEAEADTRLTHRLDNRNILGTADYVAPEQSVDSSGVDIRADIYSLGATFYFLLTARTLFPEGRTAQKLLWQQTKEPVPLAALRPDLPRELADVVHTMLAKRPADRFQTPAEVFAALDRWTQDPVPPPDEALLPKPPPRVGAARPGGAAGPRSTSMSAHQMVAAAMRGAGSSASVPRPGPGSGGDRRSGFTLNPNVKPESAAGPGHETLPVGMAQTQRRPGSGTHEPLPSVDEMSVEMLRRPPPGWGPTAAVAALLVAVAVTVCGVLVLILRG